MKNFTTLLQTQIIEDYDPQINQPSHLQISASLAPTEIARVIQEDEFDHTNTNVGEFSLIMPIMTLILLQVREFSTAVGSFIAHGPSGSSGEGLLLEAYTQFQKNEIRALRDKFSPNIDEDNKIPDMIAFLSRPLIVEEMATALKSLLSQSKSPLDSFLLNTAVYAHPIFIQQNNQLVEVSKDEALTKIHDEQGHLVQYYAVNHDGNCTKQPITILIKQEEYSDLLNSIRDNAGFIRTFTTESLITEYFPPRKELAKVVAQAFASGDLPFIRFCIENNKLYPGLLVDHKEVLFETYAKARHDLIEIMLTQQLYGYSTEQIKDLGTSKQTPLLTFFMESCTKADAAGLEMVKLLLALGLNPAAKDANGYTPLMHAVKYQAEQLSELNKPNSERSEEFKTIMRNKAEIVSLLLQDKRIDINTRAQGKTAFEIALEQGLVKNTINLTEIQGDHQIITLLIEAGCDPVFARSDSSYASKTLFNLELVVLLNLLKQPFNSFLLSPAIKIYEYWTHYLVWNKAYDDVKNPLYVATQTALNPEYVRDKLFDLAKAPMIGTFHLSWNGKVITGDSLKELMQSHLGYYNAAAGYFSFDDLPLEEDTLQMTSSEKHILSESLFNRYYLIEECLKNNWLFGWTKAGLLAIKEEIIKTYNMIDTGYEIAAGFEMFLNEVLAAKGRNALVKELSHSKEKQAIFYNMYSAVKSGALHTDINTRYNVEKVAQALWNNKNQHPSTLEYLSDKLGLITVAHNRVTFDDLVKICTLFTTDDLNFEILLRVVDQMFADDLADDREFIPLTERGKDYGISTLGSCLNKVVSAISSVTGYSKDQLYHQIADKVAITGAVGNASVQTSLKYIHDNSATVQVATGLSLGGYLSYKLLGTLKTWLAPHKQIQCAPQEDDFTFTCEDIVIDLDDGLHENFALLSPNQVPLIEI